jgi:uncharacterized membrane protein YtjA (UPF0391 family)
MDPTIGFLNMGNLLQYALAYLAVALIAATVGFGGVAGIAMEVPGFCSGFPSFVISLMAGLVRRI